MTSTFYPRFVPKSNAHEKGDSGRLFPAVASPEFRIPKSNAAYWQDKIQKNRQRDKKITRLLRKMGWRVLRIWESALRNEEAVAQNCS
jgi:G:T-mismatch repair DNA endonuclease (very short patch repair protein)